MTDAEWMAVAADVLSVKYNWSGGEVGKGFIYSGHNNGTPNEALAASADDEDGYTGTGGSATSNANQRRTLYLSSGDVVWDLAGNVSEWMLDTIDGAQPAPAGGGSYTYREWNDSRMDWGLLPPASRATVLSSVPGLADVNGWASRDGIGQLGSGGSPLGPIAFRRGGSWSTGSAAGVLTLAISHEPTFAGIYFGFRVATY